MARTVRRRRGERGISLVIGTASLLVIIPMVGLAIDAGYLYACKSRLQSAVDGAALAAARALNLGQTTAAQAANARQNAVNWFYSDFPPGNWATSNTQMDSASVQVFDSPANPNLRNVTVTATTTVPTYFMRWLNFNSTVITSTGNASRRDAVIMLVLDRSGSMATGGACDAMKNAAKLFVGQFAVGRDRIGLLSFSDGSYLHTKPRTDFQTTLGYSNSFGSGNGMIDTIDCQGGTGSAQAIAEAYNELYKMNLPGALNLILFESDGLPNTLTLNWWDGAEPSGTNPNPTGTFGFSNINGCQDSTGQSKSGGGWDTNQYSDHRDWVPTHPMNSDGVGFIPDIPAGTIGALYSSDPGAGRYFYALFNPYHPNGNYGGHYIDSNWNTPNCRFNSGYHQDVSDFLWMPLTDVFGNQLNPTNAYQPVQVSGGHVRFDTGWSTTQRWNNYHAGALNATDNAAYRARTNPNLPVYMFVIGLGGQGTDPPDYTLMQRIANDPRGDSFNTPPLYGTCASNPDCVNYTDQPQGNFVFSTNQSQLNQAFLQLSSQILRLSQ